MLPRKETDWAAYSDRKSRWRRSGVKSMDYETVPQGGEPSHAADADVRITLQPDKMTAGMADRLVVFDVDGTLCDTCEVDDVGFCEVAAEMLGVPVPPASWKAAPEITDAGILAWLWDRHLGRRP